MNPTDKDINIAQSAIEAMSKTTDFNEFERHWQDYLFRIERAWETASNYAKKTGGKCQRWISNNSTLRKKDPLLRFLKHARDAETHAVSATVDRSIKVSLADRLGRKIQLNSASVSFEDGVLTLDLQSPDKSVDWLPALLPGDPYLTRFKTRGEWYNPPTYHLNEKIKDFHPVAIAILGLEFYRKEFTEVFSLK
ncbi:hypothetical protein [Methylotenera mobilis]|uniref:Uncharacterized protein n=1 Tax=Methylotenera mobilis (strain JLW8 / ATCC BAA-1282 / DSM 17540) TaxID=583345 RepID=C6WY90_METML|nr:hypothetical protein [Methylotenera mobilis]ACT46986.1 hypothetical protein Mmol_0075 [Methylotenera mobilis JLW8]